MVQTVRDRHQTSLGAGAFMLHRQFLEWQAQLAPAEIEDLIDYIESFPASRR